MPRRVLVFVSLLASAGPAAAQLNYVPVLAPEGITSAFEERRPNLPDFRMPVGDLREAGAPRRNGLIAAMPLDERVTIGVGRFSVTEIARPPTHVEPAQRAAEVRRRDRGIAAVGVSLRF